MYCSYCGKTIPDQSKFCNFCGREISPQTNANSSKIVWDYGWFTFDFRKAYSVPPNARISGEGGYTVPGAKLYFWQEASVDILPKLQKFIDEGWQVVGEIGPSSINIRRYSKFHLGSLSSYEWCEPTEFKIQLRQPQKNG